MDKQILASFQGKSYLKEIDFTPEQLKAVVEFGQAIKVAEQNQTLQPFLKGKNVILLFAKNSTRTRLAFELGAQEMGANTVFLDPTSSQFGKKESVADTAHVLAGVADGIAYRGFAQADIEEMAADAYDTRGKHAPVWNALSDQWHPTQMIADFMTLQSEFGQLDNQITLAYVGDGRNNVARSLLVAGAMVGINVNIIAPQSLQPDQDTVKLAQEYAQAAGSQILITDDLDQGAADANVFYSDVFVSMGENNWQERLEALMPYQINETLLQKSKHYGHDLITMHCLPAYHDNQTQVAQDLHKEYPDLVGNTGIEMSDAVFKGAQARHFQQAENRKPSIMAIMAATLGNLELL
ncbi:ornithine carbamoyltransferase [Convivina intestini]|uniref:ornithine carbamoyltransferase n=1 Tax=Convivina intestini TaxID=1505726 RepID=UPI00200D0DB1|nr:ornithine carbamoyltransferase [Convivina intestini]CAH1852549.1 Ornithine carbamoyltransferase, catabolic [Convivina intestini]